MCSILIVFFEAHCIFPSQGRFPKVFLKHSWKQKWNVPKAYPWGVPEMFLMFLRSTLKYTLRCKPLNVSRQCLLHKKMTISVKKGKPRWEKRGKKEEKKRIEKLKTFRFGYGSTFFPLFFHFFSSFYPLLVHFLSTFCP